MTVDSGDITPSDDNLEWVVADALLNVVEDAANCSHRPDNVRFLFLDANSRRVFARAAIEAMRRRAALSGDSTPTPPPNDHGMAQCIFVWGDERCGLAPHHEGWHVGAQLTWKGIHGPAKLRAAAASPEGTTP